jgi:hypothetical protein
MFKQDLDVIDALRRDAVHVREPHISGIKKLSAYAGQLSWIGGKFPIDVRNLLLAKPHANTILLDWCRLHMVPGTWLQYRKTDFSE